MSDEIRIEIKATTNGWYAYITQLAGPLPLTVADQAQINMTAVSGNRRTIGRAFQTNPEAWQWAQAFVERLRRP